jgi:hypothetical protein
MIDNGPNDSSGGSEKAKPDRPLLVALDTNGYISNNLLQNSLGSTLADLLSRSNGHLLLPEVIERELKSTFGRKLAEDVDKARRKVMGVEAITRRKILQLPDVADLRAAIDRRLAELAPLLKRAPFTLEVAQAALTRVIEKNPPSGDNNEQFRDCCIWEHCLGFAQDHDVHLVTTDGHFLERGKPDKGLAELLVRECKDKDVVIYDHRSLAKLIEHLSSSVPARNPEKLGRTIGQEVRQFLEQRAYSFGFVLGDLTNKRVSLVRINRPDHQLATFDVTYSLADKEGELQIRLNPHLTASGSCTLNVPTESISDLQIDEDRIAWTDLSGRKVEFATPHLRDGTGAPYQDVNMGWPWPMQRTMAPALISRLYLQSQAQDVPQLPEKPQDETS